MVLTASIFLVVAIAYERYIAVCNPYDYRAIVNTQSTRRRVTKLVTPVFVATVLINIPKYFETYTVEVTSKNIIFCEGLLTSKQILQHFALMLESSQSWKQWKATFIQKKKLNYYDSSCLNQCVRVMRRSTVTTWQVYVGIHLTLLSMSTGFYWLLRVYFPWELWFFSMGKQLPNTITQPIF